MIGKEVEAGKKTEGHVLCWVCYRWEGSLPSWGLSSNLALLQMSPWYTLPGVEPRACTWFLLHSDNFGGPSKVLCQPSKQCEKLNHRQHLTKDYWRTSFNLFFMLCFLVVFHFFSQCFSLGLSPGFTSFLLSLYLIEVVHPPPVPLTDTSPWNIDNQPGEVSFKFLSASGDDGAGQHPKDLLTGPHLCQEIILLYSWLLAENHKLILWIRTSHGAVVPGSWEGGRVWSDGWLFCFLIEMWLWFVSHMAAGEILVWRALAN